MRCWQKVSSSSCKRQALILDSHCHFSMSNRFWLCRIGPFGTLLQLFTQGDKRKRAEGALFSLSPTFQHLNRKFRSGLYSIKIGTRLFAFLQLQHIPLICTYTRYLVFSSAGKITTGVNKAKVRNHLKVRKTIILKPNAGCNASHSR